MTILGTYILVSLGFVAVAMIEFAVILLLNRKTTPAISQEKGLDRTKNDLKMFQSKTKINTILDENIKNTKKQNGAVPPVHVLDLIAFCVHSSAYLIFNTLYWNEYFN